MTLVAVNFTHSGNIPSARVESVGKVKIWGWMPDGYFKFSTGLARLTLYEYRGRSCRGQDQIVSSTAAFADGSRVVSFPNLLPSDGIRSLSFLCTKAEPNHGSTSSTHSPVQHFSHGSRDTRQVGVPFWPKLPLLSDVTAIARPPAAQADESLLDGMNNVSHLFFTSGKRGQCDKGI
ncbi:hypothetical protein BV25DRAFT_1841362 [Artomyces pyxidatus]|uniref:Uncharacterized protein n=1 Tax=Artomyces pyxidatus TaxID=48021 RepID=A0ACB8SN54_9AGAM|nr:hypothetical protein BV25DRAFT_1841362 [Artomyces pyxidatus]